MTYLTVPRAIESTVLQRLEVTPAVVLLGPRQVGKTTLARKLASAWPSQAVYLDMERPADRLRLDDADAYLRAQQGKLVVIDEIHRVPGLFEVLRGIIDDWRASGLRNGHFLLLGSAPLDLMQQRTLRARAKSRPTWKPQRLDLVTTRSSCLSEASHQGCLALRLARCAAG